ncbi:hypothetical protein ET495_10080 [Xylanimonas allomyrinae]|uniref:Uncharacterized protein n=1 Tax=Xylanimonas allomyrinae TaxID=2509459 RepID=A0A4P6EZN4_9MICO|nr:hypothetical protein [Xylanimonas allomyrinae]QAY63538.1 hypothetical protein ET495_10080 [Xylanimonas allomyrinae]
MPLPRLEGRRLPTAAVVLGLGLALGAAVWASVGAWVPDDAGSRPDPSSSAATEPPAPPTRPTPATPATDLADDPGRTDPEAFARAVGEALFTWDTTTTEQGEVRGRLLAVADPTGAESPGLVSDLDGYVPTPQAWELLHRYATRQWLEISAAAEPAGWEAARASAPSGVVAAGTTAVTVTGTRHRAGVWEGAPVTSQHEVAFTAFVVCEPAYPTCYLLRLSELDNPLR